MPKSKSTLPDDISRECGRVAAEMTRRQTWDIASALRKQCERWMRDGKSADAIKDELFERMKQAIADQGRRR